MATKEYHVEYGGTGWWHIRRETGAPFAFYKNIMAAESAGRVLAHQNEGVVVVHESGGALRRTDYRGNALVA